LERLYDGNEHVEIKGEHGADDVDVPPCAQKLPRIKGVDRHCQAQKGDYSDDVGGHDVISREKEAGDARRHRHRQKSGRPTREKLPAKEPEHCDISGEKSDETYRDMEDSKNG